jgi:hypothetical protein
MPCSDDAQCASGFCDLLAGLCAPAPQVGSPHAVDFVPVLSRVAGGQFVVGGQDLQTDEPTGEIWFTLLHDPEWMPIHSDITPERVLTATYSYATREVFILDETAGGMARLWGVRYPFHGTRLLGTWSRHAAWARQWLRVDRDGALLLASGKSTGKSEHAIARIDITAAGAAVCDGIDRGHRALLLPPIVDARGYTLVLQKSQGNCQGHGNCLVKRERKAELALEPATLADIGAQL